MPKVSVIIPNFNHAPYLKRRIDSVLNQTFQDFEVILLDDCSTDNSAEILNEYKNHPKVSHVVINQENSGSPFRQWAKGFELAKGDYIWIAESDDWCELTLLQTLITPLQSSDNVVLSVCQSSAVSHDGKVVFKTDMGAEQVVDGKCFISKFLFGDTMLINSGMCLFRKSILSKIDTDYLSYRSAGDWNFWIQIAREGKVSISIRHLNYFSRYATTVSSKAERTGVDILEGNRLFLLVVRILNPSWKITKKAMNKRLEIFFSQKNFYVSAEIKRNVFRNLMTLHLFMLPLYIKKTLTRKIKRLK